MSELRELARENPKEFRDVAAKIGGDVEDWMLNILDEEQGEQKEVAANGRD